MKKHANVTLLHEEDLRSNRLNEITEVKETKTYTCETVNSLNVQRWEFCVFKGTHKHSF